MESIQMRRRLAVLCSLALTACVSNKYTPVSVDSPPLPMQIDPCLEVLSIGARCIAQVQANLWMTPTPIRVNQNMATSGGKETYCFTVPPGQVWFDAESRATPPYPLRPSLVHDAAEFLGLLRHKEMGYMRLMVGVAPEIKNRATVDVMGLSGHEFECWSPGHPGTLVLYPNDAQSYGENPDYFYENNHGWAWVIIERKKP